jgi:hypothetical protein
VIGAGAGWAVAAGLGLGTVGYVALPLVAAGACAYLAVQAWNRLVDTLSSLVAGVFA